MTKKEWKEWAVCCEERAELAYDEIARIGFFAEKTNNKKLTEMVRKLLADDIKDGIKALRNYDK